MKWISDKEFIRGECPMTKEDIRILAISKMNLHENSRVLDIGTGTGTIAIQSSLFAKNGIVYTVERDKEAIDVAKMNIEKFKCNNLKLIECDGTDFLRDFINKSKEEEKFDSIFIGGSGGSLEDILELSNKALKKDGIIVLNMITLNNTYKAIEKLKELEYKLEISHVNISKVSSKAMMLIANNPIFIIKGEK